MTMVAYSANIVLYTYYSSSTHTSKRVAALVVAEIYLLPACRCHQIDEWWMVTLLP